MPDGLKRVLDYSDYASIPEDGKRYEIIVGELFVTPAPRPVHQRVVGRLYSLLRTHFADKAEVFFAPIDLILASHDVLQPDLVVVDDRRTITERGIEGPPLLVVEVLSESTAEKDRGIKARRYAELGVRNYWIVDPETRRVECHRLGAIRFERVTAAAADEVLKVPAFEGLALPLAVLWAESEAPVREG